MKFEYIWHLNLYVSFCCCCCCLVYIYSFILLKIIINNKLISFQSWVHCLFPEMMTFPFIKKIYSNNMYNIIWNFENDFQLVIHSKIKKTKTKINCINWLKSFVKQKSNYYCTYHPIFIWILITFCLISLFKVYEIPYEWLLLCVFYFFLFIVRHYFWSQTN